MQQLLPIPYHSKKFQYYTQTLWRIKPLPSHCISLIPYSLVWGLPVCKLSIWCVHNKLLLITTWGVHWFPFCYFWTFREDLIKGYHLWWVMENAWKESVKLQKGRTEDNGRHCPNLVSDPWWGWCWELLLTPLFLSRLSSAKLAPTTILEE